MNRSVLILICLTSLLVQFYARFAAAPVVDFTMDDWALLERAGRSASAWDAVKTAAREPDRPLGAAFLTLNFHLFGDRPLLYNLYSYMVNSIFLLVIVLLAHALTANALATALTGLAFATFPNLTESFNWHTMVAYAPGYIGYAASALFWVYYLKSARSLHLVASLALFAVGLGSYEFGIALPVAYALLITRSASRRNVIALFLFFALVGIYLAWKFTKGFGLAHGVLFPSRPIGFSLATAFWNAGEVGGWWIGGNMFNAIREGFNGFAQLGKWSFRLFALGNLAVAVLLGRYLLRMPAGDPAPIAPSRALWFGIAWVVLTHAPSLVSWSVSRLNYLPAAGMAIVLGLILVRIERRTWIPLLAALLWIGLTASQGTSNQWRQSGDFQRRMFQYLQQTQPSWRAYDVVLFNTMSLRQRQTPGLRAQPADDPRTWAYWGNASLIRGFTPMAMVALIQPKPPRPQVIVDVECGARFEGQHLYWHERWDPSKPRTTPLHRVYIVDALQAGSYVKP